MINNGLVDEVKGLVPYQHFNALQTVGYCELFDYLNNISLPDAVNRIKTNTRHYAKRQLTWFKKDNDINWHSPSVFSIKSLLLSIVAFYIIINGIYQ